MNKYYGSVGYATTVKTSPGIYTPTIVERKYYGDIMSNFRRLDNGDGVNDNVTLNSKFSIVADPYAFDNFRDIRYVEYMGTKWKVTNVEVVFPRLILTAGGVWNDEESQA